MLRAVMAVCLGLTLALGLTVGAVEIADTPAGAVEPVAFDVPATPSGDVLATASAPPATAPFLRVTILGIGPAPVPNTGGTVSLPFATWGFSGAQTFTLSTCTTEVVSSCTSLANADRTIIQTAPFSASIDAPSEAFTWPEQQVTVSAHNEGGGVAVARVSGGIDYAVGPNATDLNQRLTNDAPTVLDLSNVVPPAVGSAVSVKRCSAYASDYRPRDYIPVACEAPSARAAIDFISKVTAYTTSMMPTGSPLPSFLVTDPALAAHADGSETVTDLGPISPSFPFQVSWRIQDAAGNTVVGPVSAAANVSRGLADITIDPSAEPGGAMLDGTYTLVVTNTVSTPAGMRSASTTRPLALVRNPPRPPAPGATTVGGDVWRMSGTYDPASARWRVPAIGDVSDVATVSMYDAGGHLVDADVPVAATCGEQPCSSTDSDAYFPLWWDWTDSDGHIVGPGVYRAVASIPDRWGRPVVVPLGTVRSYWPDLAQRSFSVRLAHAKKVTRHWRSYDITVPKVAMIRPTTLDLHVNVSVAHVPARKFRHGKVPAPGYSARFRIPGLTDWRRIHAFAPSSVFGGVIEVPFDVGAASISGRTVQVQVKGPSSKVRVHGVGGELGYWFWSLG
ncbi:hypothetical protein [Nocardioides sp. Iso805N]|uniref:hypothetical protein n=1 Tax=Nocardioides sp. Iso805N TaxID=1283287 RepID=UPI0003790E16|nr:hypothetical protein [Nocardioides sp. Iso805N]